MNIETTKEATDTVDEPDDSWQRNCSSDGKLPALADDYHRLGEPLQDRLEYIEIDSRFERDPDQLTISQRIGQGNFSDVFNGLLSLPVGKIPVAVKTPKSIAESTSLSSRIKQEKLFQLRRQLLKDELKVMAYLQSRSGGHENVTKLLGAITTNKSDFCILIEYCEWGSMDTFLRNKFKNGEFENEIVFEENDNEQVWKKERDASWAENYESRREKGHVTTSDLLWFALQIARAMQFLTDNKVLHRDVALRNVLLKSDFTLKVSDFGLSRRLCEGDEAYQIWGNSTALPIRYMAPECIIPGRFTIYSERWSYGVVVWELFTFAVKQPYSSEFDDKNLNSLFDYLSSGQRLNLPDTVPKKLKSLVTELWNEDPVKRPSFQSCRKLVRNELLQSCEKILLNSQTSNLYASEVSLFCLEDKEDEGRFTGWLRNQPRWLRRLAFLSMIAALLIAISTFIIIIINSTTKNEGSNDDNETDFLHASIARDQNRTHFKLIPGVPSGNKTFISVMPDGTGSFVFVFDSGNQETLFIDSLTGKQNFVHVLDYKGIDSKTVTWYDTCAVMRSRNIFIIALVAFYAQFDNKMMLLSYSANRDRMVMVDKSDFNVDIQTDNLNYVQQKILQDDQERLYWILFFEKGHKNEREQNEDEQNQKTAFYLFAIDIDDSGNFFTKTLIAEQELDFGVWHGPFIRDGALYWPLLMNITTVTLSYIPLPPPDRPPPDEVKKTSAGRRGMVRNEELDKARKEDTVETDTWIGESMIKILLHDNRSSIVPLANFHLCGGVMVRWNLWPVQIDKDICYFTYKPFFQNSLCCLEIDKMSWNIVWLEWDYFMFNGLFAIGKSQRNELLFLYGDHRVQMERKFIMRPYIAIMDFKALKKAYEDDPFQVSIKHPNTALSYTATESNDAFCVDSDGKRAFAFDFFNGTFFTIDLLNGSQSKYEKSPFTAVSKFTEEIVGTRTITRTNNTYIILITRELSSNKYFLTSFNESHNNKINFMQKIFTGIRFDKNISILGENETSYSYDFLTDQQFLYDENGRLYFVAYCDCGFEKDFGFHFDVLMIDINAHGKTLIEHLVRNETVFRFDTPLRNFIYNGAIYWMYEEFETLPKFSLKIVFKTGLRQELALINTFGFQGFRKYDSASTTALIDHMVFFYFLEQNSIGHIVYLDLNRSSWHVLELNRTLAVQTERNRMSTELSEPSLLMGSRKIFLQGHECVERSCAKKYVIDIIDISELMKAMGTVSSKTHAIN